MEGWRRFAIADRLYRFAVNLMEGCAPCGFWRRERKAGTQRTRRKNAEVAEEERKSLRGVAMFVEEREVRSLFTIGHSTLSIEAFLRALKENGVELLVDVRRYPGSRRHPQFGQEALFNSLRAVGIAAEWREGLGGRRAAMKDSVNTGWRESSFRGYADYMQTAKFGAEIDWLVDQAEAQPTVVMCAESVPWRCHRGLIADAVIARGWVVEDIFVAADGKSSRKVHAMTPFARVDAERVWYPAETGELFAR
jgi:hypothetical protein